MQTGICIDINLWYLEYPAEFYEIFCGILLNTEFRKIRIPPELFFDGIMDTVLNLLNFTLYNAVLSLVLCIYINTVNDDIWKYGCISTLCLFTPSPLKTITTTVWKCITRSSRLGFSIEISFREITRNYSKLG